MLVLLISKSGSFVDSIILSQDRINILSDWISDEKPYGINLCGSHSFVIENPTALENFKTKIANIAKTKAKANIA